MRARAGRATPPSCRRSRAGNRERGADERAPFRRTCAGDVIRRIYLERGTPVLLRARWSGPGPRNVLIERPDGERVVRPFRGLRRSPAGDGMIDPHRGRELELLRTGDKPAATLLVG